MKKHNLYNRLSIDEVYEVSKDILGKGGYGEVRTIIHRSARVERVAKIIFKRRSNDKMLKRIKQEIKVLSQLDHPNILKIYEYFEDNSRLYIITEYLKGGELLKGWNLKNKTEPDLVWIMK